MKKNDQVDVATNEPAPALAQVKTRRRPWLWAVSVLLIALGALLAGAVVNMVKTTVPVVLASKEVQRGAIITREDLAVVEVHPDPSLKTVPAADLESLVGRTALIDVPQGSLLAPTATGDKPTVDDGQALVGVALTPAQMPSGELKPDQSVQLVSTPRAGDDITKDKPVISVQATVISTSVITDTNLIVVNVAVPEEVAESVAALSATGRVGLIVKGN